MSLASSKYNPAPDSAVVAPIPFPDVVIFASSTLLESRIETPFFKLLKLVRLLIAGWNSSNSTPLPALSAICQSLPIAPPFDIITPGPLELVTTRLLTVGAQLTLRI